MATTKNTKGRRRSSKKRRSFDDVRLSGILNTLAMQHRSSSPTKKKGKRKKKKKKKSKKTKAKRLKQSAQQQQQQQQQQRNVSMIRGQSPPRQGRRRTLPPRPTRGGGGSLQTRSTPALRGPAASRSGADHSAAPRLSANQWVSVTHSSSSPLPSSSRAVRAVVKGSSPSWKDRLLRKYHSPKQQQKQQRSPLRRVPLRHSSSSSDLYGDGRDASLAFLQALRQKNKQRYGGVHDDDEQESDAKNDAVASSSNGGSGDARAQYAVKTKTILSGPSYYSWRLQQQRAEQDKAVRRHQQHIASLQHQRRQ
eukprot:TRINITY_DN66421_c2_g9_i1.p1 TRINITY_DN66421_c2_g9~~TRINITY_DN66421_c2_g9_i1.p1  ORF type:complete len:350 (-),score=187.22 TRINITY_DN66421_c2_g9_i1:186-1109(-)